MRQTLQPKLFQVPHTVFAFRGVLHDPLRELRPDAPKLLLRVHLDTLRTQFFPSAIKSARQIVQRTWPEGKLTFNLVRHLMYPLLEAGAQNSRSVARVECADDSKHTPSGRR